MKWITKLIRWLGIYPKDWRVVWSEHSYFYKGTEDNVTGRCFYTISFSESRDFFVLSCEGYMPKSHSVYGNALAKLAEYNNELLEIRFKSKSKK